MIPNKFLKGHKSALRKDERYFKLHPNREEYTRPAVWGEFWPMDVPPDTEVRVFNLGEGVRVRHALTDSQKPFEGYEEEADKLQEAYAHITETELNETINALREKLDGKSGLI